jgi:hypothetical protein
MAAEIRVDTIKSRSGINTISLNNNSFSVISNVGIGTTVATSKLEVVGAVNLSGTPFYQNTNTITQSYTIPVNTNSASYGPIGINTGVTVGVATGSYWKVL